MNVKKIAGTATLAAALGAAALGLGAGSAQADPGWGPNVPWIPGPPGHVKNFCPGPCGTPPGHWIDGPHGPPIPDIWTPWWS